MHNSSLVAIAQYFWRIRTFVLYGNQKKFNTEAVNDYPPIRFEIRFERKFPIVGLYFLTLPVETLWNLCPVENLFGMRMAGLCQFYWRTCSNSYHWLGIRTDARRRPIISEVGQACVYVACLLVTGIYTIIHKWKINTQISTKYAAHETIAL